MGSPGLDRLAGKIRKVCQHGFDVDEKTWHYVQSTMENPTPSKVATIINATDDCEGNSLIELLFYPNETIQLLLEPTLESVQFTRRDQANLMELLLSRPFDTILMFHDFNQSIKIKMPEPALRRLVDRLNLTVLLPFDLIDILNRHLPEKLGKLIKVRLRNTSMDFADHQVKLLGNCFTKLDHAQPDYQFWIDFILSILPEIKPSTRVYDFFMNKKKFYVRSVEIAEQFRRKLSCNNIETLMMQGERPTYIPIDESRKFIAAIDQICGAIFGYSDNLDELKRDQMHVDNVKSPENLAKIIDYLS
jgi:hypothetical protein